MRKNMDQKNSEYGHFLRIAVSAFFTFDSPNIKKHSISAVVINRPTGHISTRSQAKLKPSFP